MKKIIVRLLLLILAVILYIAAFVTSFLYGSSWISNSAYTLAILPSFTAASVTVFFSIRLNKPSVKWRWIDYGLVCVVVIAFAFISLGLLGTFSHHQKIKNIPNEAGSGFIRSNNASIYYYQSKGAMGKAPVILVLHGGPGSGSYVMRAELCDSLDSDFRMIYFDQRGTGRSSWATSFTLDDYINDIENLRKALNVESWYLFSASWGTVLANEYTIRYPTKVEGVINWGGLIDSQVETNEMIRHIIRDYEAKKNDREISFWKEMLNQKTIYTRFQTLRTVNRVNRNGLKSKRDRSNEVERILAFRTQAINEWGYKKEELGANLWVTLATIMQMNLEHYDFSPRLKEIDRPYLFLAGRYDPQMNFEELNRYKMSMPNARVEVVENSGHLFDNPKDLIEKIKAFVQRK